ncbi:hypothetical protein YB2330_005859 [Saitoella coloradoensis]
MSDKFESIKSIVTGAVQSKEFLFASGLAVAVMGLFTAPTGNWFLTSDERMIIKEDESVFIKKHSSLDQPSGCRVFYRRHMKEPNLPKELPLLIFVHGLGGQLNQFEGLLEFFAQSSHVMAIDMPGCGRSPTAWGWEPYKTESLVKTLTDVITRRMQQERHKTCVLIGHSYGTNLVARLASMLHSACRGLVAMAPGVMTPEKMKLRLVAARTPELMFDMYRRKDRKGGLRSMSVKRMVASTAPNEMRLRQLRWNLQSQTYVWRRMVYGMVPADLAVWNAVNVPVLLMGGEEDAVTAITDLDIIYGWLNEMARKAKPIIVRHAGHSLLAEKVDEVAEEINNFLIEQVEPELDYGRQQKILDGTVKI